MNMRLKPGDKLPLSHHLGDGVTGKYVRAVVKNPDGSQIPGSPVTLTDVGNGTYYDDSLEMPSQLAIMAAFSTYDDSGFSEKTEGYDDSFDMYLLDESEILSLEDSITGSFQDLSTIYGQVDDISTFRYLLEDQNNIEANIFSPSPFFGELEDAKSFIGTIED